MAKFNEKISTRVKHQSPDFVLDEHPRFLEFVKQYYTFMESAEISVTSVLTSDGVLLESETDLHPNKLILDASHISSGNTQRVLLKVIWVMFSTTLSHLIPFSRD